MPVQTMCKACEYGSVHEHDYVHCGDCLVFGPKALRGYLLSSRQERQPWTTIQCVDVTNNNNNDDKRTERQTDRSSAATWVHVSDEERAEVIQTGRGGEWREG